MMADEPEDDVLDLENQAPQDEGETPEQQEEQKEAESDEDEPPVVVFGEEEPPEEATIPDNSTIRELRKAIKERDKRLAEFERQKQPQTIEVGPKPTLAGCDYDEEAFETALDEWKEQDRQAKDQQTAAQQQAKAAQEEWQRDLTAYQTKKATLGFDDVEESEEVVTSKLSQVQQAVIIKAAADPAHFIYGLGKHDSKLTELAGINDPIKLAAAVARLEGTMKMIKRKRAPEPEKVVNGTAPHAANVDKELERLEKEADRTGNRTKVIAYKRSLKKGV